MMKQSTNPENKESGRGGDIIMWQAGNTSPELEVHLEKKRIRLNQGGSYLFF
jgi:hypothetical protein